MPDRPPLHDPDIALCDSTLAMHAQEAIAVLQGMVERLRRAERPFQLAYTLAMLCRSLSMAERRAQAEVAALESLSIFRGLGSLGGEAMALNALGINAVGRGDHARALDCLNQALPLARDSNWPDLAGRIANTLGIALNDMGRHAQAAEVLEEAWRQTQRDTSPRLRLRLMNNLSLALARWALREREDGLPRELTQPRAERAATLASEGTALCRANLPSDLATTLDNLATAQIVLDDLPAAHAALDEAEAIFLQVGDDHSLVFVAGNRARACLQGHDPMSAVRALQSGLAAAERAKVSNHLDELHLLLSQAWEMQGDLAQALAAYKQFHALRSRFVLESAVQKAQALAVTLDTERAVRESRQDALTGLANRRAFDESLARLLPRAGSGQALALAILDLDHFKQINDHHGHIMGDEALSLVAELLRRHSRETDVAARLGGDEFALLISGPPGAALALCERVREQLGQQSRERWPQGPRLTMSIGLAETETPMPQRELMARADAALYSVKAAGRDGIRTG